MNCADGGGGMMRGGGWGLHCCGVSHEDPRSEMQTHLVIYYGEVKIANEHRQLHKCV